MADTTPEPRTQYRAFKEAGVPPKKRFKKISNRFVLVPEEKIKGVRWSEAKSAWLAYIGGYTHPVRSKWFRTREEAVTQRRAWLDEITASV